MIRALLVAAAFTGAAGASEVSVDARRAGEAVEIVANAQMRADAGEAWRVLTAYDRYSSFIPDLVSTRILSRDGDRAVVEYRGSARFLWMVEPMTVRLEITETPQRLIESRLISGTVRDLRGRYELVRTDDGGSRLEYRGRIVLDEESAGLFDMIAVRSNASRQFRALVAEIERVSAIRTDNGGRN
jgi:ribosome-associated toxin RatA of RatAB toxin-antitoxin module